MLIKNPDIFIDFRSVYKGIFAMKRNHGKVTYFVKYFSTHRLWFHAWTPGWHEGRGPYVTIGLWWIIIGRGY